VDRKSEMMKLRTEDGLSLQEIGAIYGVSRERVRQIIGNVPRPRQLKSLEDMLYKKVLITTYCWLWQGPTDDNGYGRIDTGIANVGNYAHRLSWFIENGPIPKKMRVFHYCNNPSCVRPSHLYIGTPNTNQGRRGGWPRGREKGYRKLNETEMITIKELLSSGKIDPVEIAEMFEVSPMTLAASMLSGVETN
jgi:HNH endonuclease/Sigma-70, region 4